MYEHIIIQYLKRLRNSKLTDGSTIVIGNEACDADSLISSFCLSFIRNWNSEKEKKRKEKEIIYIPSFNCLPKFLELRVELISILKILCCKEEWLMTMNYININILIEKAHLLSHINLILTDCHLISQCNNLLAEIPNIEVTEIIDHHEVVNRFHEDFSLVDFCRIESVGSCCTLVADEFIKEYEVNLKIKIKIKEKEKEKQFMPFLILLLGVILIDTRNLESMGKCTDIDKKVVNKILSIIFPKMFSLVHSFPILKHFLIETEWDAYYSNYIKEGIECGIANTNRNEIIELSEDININDYVLSNESKTLFLKSFYLYISRKRNDMSVWSVVTGEEILSYDRKIISVDKKTIYISSIPFKLSGEEEFSRTILHEICEVIRRSETNGYVHYNLLMCHYTNISNTDNCNNDNLNGNFQEVVDDDDKCFFREICIPRNFYHKQIRTLILNNTEMVLSEVYSSHKDIQIFQQGNTNFSRKQLIPFLLRSGLEMD